MKKIITTTICLAVLFLSLDARTGVQVQKQELKEDAILRITYDCNAPHRDTYKTYRWNLDIGRTQSIFYSPNYRLWKLETDKIKSMNDVAKGIAEYKWNQASS